jgi:benzylsuccinate synthase
MADCSECASFFKIPQGDLDYEPSKGDCVMEMQDQKGKFWLSRPVMETDAACGKMQPKRS